MEDSPAYCIDDIVTSKSGTATAFEEIMSLTERVTQQKLNVTPSPYVGPHYGLEDGLAIIRKYQLDVTQQDTSMGTARRVESHWQEGYETISGNGFWAGN